MKTSKDFQDRTLSYLINNPEAMFIVGNTVQVEHFDEGIHRVLYTVLHDIVRRTNKIPTQTELLSRVGRWLKGQSKGALVTQMLMERALRIVRTPISCTEDEVWNFVLHQELKLVAGTTMASTSDKAEETFKDVMERLDKIRSVSHHRSEGTLLSPFSDAWLNNDELNLEDLYSGVPMPTKWARIDACRRNGGIWRQELVLLGAATGSGKTMALVDLACNLAEQKHRVLFFSIDNLQGEIHQRFLARSSDISMDLPPDMKAINAAARSWMMQHDIDESYLHVKLCIPKKTSFEDILRTLTMAERRWGKFDCVIVDYLDLMTRNAKKQGWEDLEDMATGLRGLGGEKDVAVITATQGNKEAMRSEVTTLDTFYGAVSKSFPAGLVLTINQTDAERQMDPCQCRIAIPKNTRGKKNLVFPFFVDFSRAKYWENLAEDPVDITTAKSMIKSSETKNVLKSVFKRRVLGDQDFDDELDSAMAACTKPEKEVEKALDQEKADLLVAAGMPGGSGDTPPPENVGGSSGTPW